MRTLKQIDREINDNHAELTNHINIPSYARGSDYGARLAALHKKQRDLIAEQTAVAQKTNQRSAQ